MRQKLPLETHVAAHWCRRWEKQAADAAAAHAKEVEGLEVAHKTQLAEERVGPAGACIDVGQRDQHWGGSLLHLAAHACAAAKTVCRVYLMLRHNAGTLRSSGGSEGCV